MKRAIWLFAAVLPLCAQPRQLSHAQLDTRSATGAVEQEFRSLLKAQPQPAWIGYSIPGSGADSNECWNGVVHLEGPEELFLLFRIDAGAITQIRILAPDCTVDGGGVPLHWLTGVRPAESARWLQTLALRTDLNEALRRRAIRALAASKGPEAVDALVSIARTQPNSQLGRQAVNALARSRDRRARAFFEDVLKR